MNQSASPQIHHMFHNLFGNEETQHFTKCTVPVQKSIFVNEMNHFELNSCVFSTFLQAKKGCGLEKVEILEIAVKFIRKMKNKMSDDTAMNRAGKDTGKLPCMIIHPNN